jgi:Xaa-Pro dipeptidase
MFNKVPLVELQNRMKRFIAKMEATDPNWEMVVIFSKINQYYFTGTMHDGMLLIPREGNAEYWVRRSFERAVDESLFPIIKPMKSYRDAAQSISKFPSAIYMEKEIVPVAMLERFRKYFRFETVKSADAQIAAVRAVKSGYELDLLRKSGKIHRRVLEDIIPSEFKAGMSEAELASKLYAILIEQGHHGLARLARFDTFLLLGNVCFGESSIYPTFFDGPGGNYGMSPAVPSFGNRNNKLKKGDLIFIDIGCGVDGYHTDKTMTYMFGKALPDEVIKIHQKCVDIQNKVASMLRHGAVPEEIYKEIINSLDSSFLKNFMGFGNSCVKFIGHGIGLSIDEYPVIAEGFTEPLQEGMVLSIEPKKGIKGIGMVGTENTYIVTPSGGECITGNHPGLLLV